MLPLVVVLLRGLYIQEQSGERKEKQEVYLFLYPIQKYDFLLCTKKISLFFTCESFSLRKKQRIVHFIYLLLMRILFKSVLYRS